MALPGHSPPPLAGSGSPTRMLKGHVETQLPPMYGHPMRSMMPPSPQNYRFPNPPPIPVPSPSLSMPNDSRITAPYKRPGSSMSISSMLGGEPERPAQEMYPNHNSRGSSRHGSISAPAPNFLAMSPPQQPSKPGPGEYFYKPRSQTPEKIGIPFGTSGARQRSSSSGTPLSRPPPFAEPHNRSASTIPAPRYVEQPPNPAFNGGFHANDHEERARRTSLNGILQRPSSQPQISQQPSQPHDPFRPTAMFSVVPDRQLRPETIPADPFQRNGAGTTYDIKPPGSHHAIHPNGVQLSPTRGPSLPNSPDMRRSSASGSQGRTLASILNGPPTQPAEPASVAQRMMRQDSTQSQSDRSIFGDRGKSRQYSPFAGSLPPYVQHTSGVPTDESSRKGSDELSQHRVLLSLAAESKRGRYSPMPQVVQGAQAQTPVPDAGVKTEHGRVFSGLGGGIGSTPTPSSNQMRKDDNRTPLNEDNLLKVSRSTPGLTKRSRKVHDDDAAIDADYATGGKSTNGRVSKKGKYQHSYKLDLEELANQGSQRRPTPLTGLNPNRNASVTSNSALATANHGQHSRSSDVTPILKPKKTVRVATVFNAAFKSPRRHLGSFTYRPEISPSDLRKPSFQRFDVSIKTNLLPSFSAAEHMNCTYTVHVPRIWLQNRERGLICAEQYLWGSGIYTDDSDPITAAIHAGFLKASLGATVDTALLSRVIHDQNPRIEWPEGMKIPEQPLDIEPGKDLNITLVVLPLLERYDTSARFGIRSRAWPEGLDKTQHDGVSFGVLHIEFVNIGAEEMKMGRTGASRRERLRLDLEARQRGLQIQKDRIEIAKRKRLTQTRPSKLAGSLKDERIAPTSVPITFTNSSENAFARQVVSAVA